jgi:hypothetical protein
MSERNAILPPLFSSSSREFLRNKQHHQNSSKSERAPAGIVGADDETAATSTFADVRTNSLIVSGMDEEIETLDDLNEYLDNEAKRDRQQ